MRMVKDATGRFALRPYFAPEELDEECESIVCNFLRERHGCVRFPISTDDLTVLLEREAEDLDLYADLHEYGTAVEGVTIFAPESKPRVKISADLSNDDRRGNRLRTTLAHEFGHTKFHRFLFDQRLTTWDMFEDRQATEAPERPRQICRRDTIVGARWSDWMEWQAGHVCGAILMPATSVRDLLRTEFPERIYSSGIAIDDPVTTALKQQVQTAYAVSAEAAQIRLIRLGVVKDGPTGVLI